MAPIPSGTVTFLFTDIEGSTRLAEKDPDRWEVVRDRHHAILHSAIRSCNGYVFNIIGDAFCVAFHNANDAVRAAVSSQQALFAENWGDMPIRVRMGIHTGKAEIQESGEYRGYLAMSRVQRLMSAGHGGQVLISLATQELVRDKLLEGVSLREMGEHRLRDLSGAEHIFQLNIPSLPMDFPALKTLNAELTNLPTRLDRFIGREKEVAQVKQMLEKSRLVTLVGSGGIGKTRLSIQVASDLLGNYSSGVWLVELAPITDPALVAQTVCAVLDVTPHGNTTLQDALVTYLRTRNILLVLDNCEHLIDACARLAEALLLACPSLRILASSREALGIEGENAYRVPSLSLPDVGGGLDVIAQSEAVQLFVERASAVLSDFELSDKSAPVAVQICQRLDGIALAIELAAVRVKTLKVEQIAARLDDVFHILTGGSRTALPRQQTLRALIDWSYNLLSDEERATLRRFSVFTDGWTLEAAEFVCGNPDTLNLITHLVDKSMVAVDYEHGDEARYYLLETIRQYLCEKLTQSGEIEQVRSRHLEYFVTLAEKAEPEIHGPRQIEWLQKLEEEYENFRAALAWSLTGNISVGQQLAAALWWLWEHNGYCSEGYQWLEKMLTAASPQDETITRARLLAGAGWLAEMSGYDDRIVISLSQSSVDLFRKLGDTAGAAFPLATLARRAYFRSEYDLAIKLAMESRELFISSGNKWGVSYTASGLAWPLFAQDKLEQAQIIFDEYRAICDECGNYPGKARITYYMAEILERQGNWARAVELYDEALAIARAVSEKTLIAIISNYLGEALLQIGDYARSQSLFEEALEIGQKTGDRIRIAVTLNSLAACASLQGDISKASMHFRESLQVIKQLGNEEQIVAALLDVGVFLREQGHLETFARILGLAQRIQPAVLDVLTPRSIDEIQKSIEASRAILGEAAYIAAYEAGKQMSLNEAVAHAFQALRVLSIHGM